MSGESQSMPGGVKDDFIERVEVDSLFLLINAAGRTVCRLTLSNSTRTKSDETDTEANEGRHQN